MKYMTTQTVPETRLCTSIHVLHNETLAQQQVVGWFGNQGLMKPILWVRYLYHGGRSDSSGTQPRNIGH
jgi:hypothetical protein